MQKDSNKTKLRQLKVEQLLEMPEKRSKKNQEKKLLHKKTTSKYLKSKKEN
jgi:hypothetical protein